MYTVLAEGGDGRIADRLGQLGDDGEVSGPQGVRHTPLRADAVEAAERKTRPPATAAVTSARSVGIVPMTRLLPCRRRELLDDVVDDGRGAAENQNPPAEVRRRCAVGRVGEIARAAHDPPPGSNPRRW